MKNECKSLQTTKTENVGVDFFCTSLKDGFTLPSESAIDNPNSVIFSRRILVENVPDYYSG